MTKTGKLTLLSGAALAVVMVLRMEWNAGNVSILLTGALLGIVLAGLVVWWRCR